MSVPPVSQPRLAASAASARALAPLGVPVAAFVALATLSGCYSHVVSQSGIGTGAKEVYEPNVPSDDDSDPWNRVGAGTNRGVKNWKSVTPSTGQQVPSGSDR